MNTKELYKRDQERFRADPEEEIGPVQSSLELFQKVYRNPDLPLHTRLRAARDAKDHEHPKLGISVNVNAGEDFAARLDALSRLRKAGCLKRGRFFPKGRFSRKPVRRPRQPAQAKPINGFQRRKF